MKRLNYLFSDSDDDDTAQTNRNTRAALRESRRTAMATNETPSVRPLGGQGSAPDFTSRQRDPQHPRGGEEDAHSSASSSWLPHAHQSRRHMQSLFAQDSLQTQQAHTTSLRYEEEATHLREGKHVAAAVAHPPSGDAVSHQGANRDRASDVDTPDGSSEGDRAEDARKAASKSENSTTVNPLITVTHAIVQAYQGEAYVGTCAAALCVPSGRHRRQPKAAAAPLVAIVDATKAPVCRARLDGALHLRLSRENPQYASLYVGNERAKRRDAAAAIPGADGEEPRSGCFWSLMFRDRREAVAFVAAAHTITRFAPDMGDSAAAKAPSANAIPLLVPRCGDGGNGEEAAVGEESVRRGATTAEAVVRLGDRALFGYRLWLLERVAKTSQYLSLGRTVDEVPADAPREIVVGGGALMDGMEKGIVGMREGEARLLFVGPGETRVRRGVGHPDITADDTVVAYVCCVSASVPASGRVERRKGAEDGSGDSLPADASPLRLKPPHRAGGATAAIVPADTSRSGKVAAALRLADCDAQGDAATANAAPPAPPAEDTNALLQRALLQTLLAGANGGASGGCERQKRTDVDGSDGDGESRRRTGFSSADREVVRSTSAAVARVEHATDRVQSQLLAVTDKLDRLDLRRILEENNAAMEKMVRRVVGLAPHDDAALVEDIHKDWDALLATVEKYKARYEEANRNYQTALEGIGRYADRVHALEADVRVQEETAAARLTETEERHRLRAVEAAVKHRAELDRVAEAKYREGKEEGIRIGTQLGAAQARQEAGLPAGGQHEWKEKCFAYEQEILKWKTEVQEAQGRHIRERRSLQAEIDSLQLLCQRLGARQEDLAVRVPEENAEQQCKRLKRALNAVYAQVEAQLAAHTAPIKERDTASELVVPAAQGTSGDETVSVKDALSALIIAIKSEAKVFTREIKTEAALRGHENEMLAQVRRERREMGGANSISAQPAPPAEADTGASRETAAEAPPQPPRREADPSLDDATGRLYRTRAASDAATDHHPFSDAHSGGDVPDEPRRSTQPFAKAPADADSAAGVDSAPTPPRATDPPALGGDGTGGGEEAPPHSPGRVGMPFSSLPSSASASPPAAEPQGDATSAAETEETPVGRLAVRLDYGSAQTPPSDGEEGSRERSLPGLAPEGSRLGERPTADAPRAEDAVDSPIPSAGGRPLTGRWGSVDVDDAFHVSSPGSELRGRDTSAPAAAAGAALLPPPPPEARRRGGLSEGSIDAWEAG